ncbi:RCC1-like G exchanging factor-like protein [Macrobrachium nipponense]|uniref:RCC1-like G exchanging factor-like protein n=1 Tax=Macrobrachium nipponense TaxID=159736 RepID=UPI0030C84796
MITTVRRAFTTSFLQPVLQGVECRPEQMGVFKLHVRGKTKYRKPMDPSHADEVPEFQFVGLRNKADTLAYVWGVADHGGLGRASFLRPDPKSRQKRMHYRFTPHRLGLGEYYEVKDLACGYGFTLFAVNDSSVSCFGTGLNTDSQIGNQVNTKKNRLGMLISPGPLDIPLTNQAKVKKVAAGRAHTVMLTDSAGVWTVGNNAYGQCGRPVITDEDYSRKSVYHQIRVLEDKKIEHIECGQDTSFFLSGDGVVYSCGWSADGQTCRGHYNNEPNVGPIVGDVEGEKIIKVSCRGDCALALSDKGEVFGWGNNEYHQLSSVTQEMQIHTSRKMDLPGVGRIVDIASGGTMCLALNEDGDVFSWGFGFLGKGPEVSYSKTPVQIPSTLLGRTPLTPEAKVVSVYSGVNSFAAVNNIDSLYTWGKNPGGCLGLGHLKDQYFPFRVALAGGIRKVSIGVDHMAVLVKEVF